MKRASTRGLRKAVVLLLVSSRVAAWAAGQPRNVNDRAIVTDMMSRKNTVCVGRFLVDVPTRADFSLAGGRIAGFEIDAVVESKTVFADRMATREAELRARDATDDRTGNGGLIAARDLAGGGLFGRSFFHGRSRGYMMEGDRRIDMASVSVEAHAYLDGLSSTLSATAVQEGSVREAEALLARLRLRGEYEIPNVPGFCIWRAVFVDPLPKHTSEWITLHVGLPDHPDMGLAFDSTAGGRTDSSLLERVAHTDAEADLVEKLSVTKLRSGKRRINGIDGEEEIERVGELNFTTGYNLMWGSQGSEGDPLRPFLLMNIETGTNLRPGGRPVDSSLYEDAVLALWDGITSSIRLGKPDVITGDTESVPDKPSSQPCLQLDKTRCMSGEVMFDIRRFGERTAHRRPSIRSSTLDSIVKLVSTLP